MRGPGTNNVRVIALCIARAFERPNIAIASVLRVVRLCGRSAGRTPYVIANGHCVYMGIATCVLCICLHYVGQRGIWLCCIEKKCGALLIEDARASFSRSWLSCTGCCCTRFSERESLFPKAGTPVINHIYMFMIFITTRKRVVCVCVCVLASVSGLQL